MTDNNNGATFTATADGASRDECLKGIHKKAEALFGHTRVKVVSFDIRELPHAGEKSLADTAMYRATAKVVELPPEADFEIF